jgi:hypothetical protein
MSTPESQTPGSQTSVTEVAKPAKHHSSGWVFGLAVVIIGGLLLARNLGLELFFLDFHNWWAFFILAAAINPLFHAWQSFQKEGLSSNTLNSLVSGSTIVFIALIFLLDLSLMTWWPSFIIIGGLYMMTSGRR